MCHPLNPLRISGNEPTDAAPATWITSQNGAKREALLRVPGGSGGWSARPGCPAKRRAEPSFPPRHQGAKEPVLGASPSCRQPLAQGAANISHESTETPGGWHRHSRSGHQACHPAQLPRPVRQPDGPSLLPEASGPPRGLQGSCHARGSPPWIPAPPAEKVVLPPGGTLTSQIRYDVCLVAQSCPALCEPMDYSLPGSSVQGILQARILEGVTMPPSGGSSQPRDRTQVSQIAGGFFNIRAKSSKINKPLTAGGRMRGMDSKGVWSGHVHTCY